MIAGAPGPGLRRSLAREVGVSGVALHGGQPARARLRPAPVGSGRVFTWGDRPPLLAHIDAVEAGAYATLLAGQGWRLRTVEHLLAACAALDIDDVEIAVDGDELPVLDGSAGPWLRALLEAGPVDRPGARPLAQVRQPVTVGGPGRWARLSPGPGLVIAISTRFSHPALGLQHLEIAIDGPRFAKQIADARTFGFLHEVEALRARGLVRGGSLDNAVVYGPDGPINPGGLRWPDEVVRHKLLDVLGDLALLGHPLEGRVEAECPGHSLTHALLRAAIAQPGALEIAPPLSRTPPSG